MPLLHRFAVVLFASLAAVGLAVACTPEIGDNCIVSTDCSRQGDRLCDVSQPGGYCTQLNCRGNDCADEAACVLFGSAVAGCLYDDRAGQYGSRVARSFCMKACTSNVDCRAGYICEDPRTFPWSAVILDKDQSKRGCLPVPLEDRDGGIANQSLAPAQVCAPATPIDASVPIDATPAQIVEAGSVVVPPLFSTPDGG